PRPVCCLSRPAASPVLYTLSLHDALPISETSLGMVPGWSGTQRLVRRFGPQIVRRMVLGGETFTAEEACGHGLVDHVVETGGARSEEHTSELQSRENLVCRLLLEKKKKAE